MKLTKSCYVSMPFGRKPNPEGGGTIDFDQIYERLIRPSILAAGASCDRGDDFEPGAVLQKRMLSRVLQSDLMLADVSGRNPNVVYELGIRFATQPLRTLILDGSGAGPFFHVNSVPRIIYRLDDGIIDSDLQRAAAALQTAVEKALASNAVTSPVFEFFPHLHVRLPRDPCVFIGHGGSPLWSEVQGFLESELQLKTVSYESDSQVGLSIVQVLETMLSKASFAVLVMTAEDATGDQKLRARQNVVHEAGLFQGSLGFARAIVLREAQVEEFSNLYGLQHIAFEGANIEQTFPELRRVLKREKLVA